MMHLEEKLLKLNEAYSEISARRPITTAALVTANAIHDEIVSTKRLRCKLMNRLYLVPILLPDSQCLRSRINWRLALSAAPLQLVLSQVKSDGEEVRVATFDKLDRVTTHKIDYDHIDEHRLAECGLDGLGLYQVMNTVAIATDEFPSMSDKPSHYLICLEQMIVEVFAVSSNLF